MDNSLNALSKCDEEPVAVEEWNDRGCIEARLIQWWPTSSGQATLPRSTAAEWRDRCAFIPGIGGSGGAVGRESGTQACAPSTTQTAALGCVTRCLEIALAATN